MPGSLTKQQRQSCGLWFLHLSQPLVCIFFFFSFFLKVAHHIESHLGRAQSLFAFRTATPFSCHLNKDRGEGRGGRDDLRKGGGVNMQTEKRSSIQSGGENLSNKSIKV